jgi:E3 ubiquitin-protein ligase RNF13
VDRISAFGPRIDKAITGTVILSENKYGCSPLINISQNHTIVLVERGQCSFLQKVLMMQQSGASAVIVGDRFFNGWITLYAPGKYTMRVKGHSIPIRIY